MSYQPPSPGFFDTFRSPPFPTLYPDHKTPVTQDVLYVGWCTAFLTIFVSFCVIIPGSAKSFKEQFLVFVRATLTLGIGLVVMACNFGQEWEVGTLDTHTPYKAGTGEEIYARVGLQLSLRSVNITLRALEEPHGALEGETINYNERFWWTWQQGRAGFGPFAGEIQRNFRSSQFRGSPLPILWVAEYFTFDGEGIRFGRNYRTAGWFAHICIWLAFPLWILTIILFKLRIDYGAHTLTTLGASLLMAALIWAFRRNFIELEIPFADGVLKTKFGVHWYLALIVGIVCLCGGLLIYFLDRQYHNEMSELLGNNPLTVIEQEIVVESEKETQPSDKMEMGEVNAPLRPAKPVAVLRSRGTTKRYNKHINYPAYQSQQHSPQTYYNQGQQQVVGGYYYDEQGNYHQDPNYHHQGYHQDYQNQAYEHDQADQGYQNQDYQQEQAQAYPEGYPEGYYDQGYSQDYQGYGQEGYVEQGQYDNSQEELYCDVQSQQAPQAPPRPPKRH